jgi:uncharacterized membrane protein
MSKMILGLYKSRKSADDAYTHFKEEGFQGEEISVITSEDSTKEKAEEGLGGGALTGGVVGGIAGLLISLTPVVVPGLGALLIAGPLTILTSTLLGLTTGGLIGALVDLGLSESTARVYEGGLKRGGVLLAVLVDDESRDKARKIMNMHKAEHIALIPYAKKSRISEIITNESYGYSGSKGGKVK